MSTNIMCAVMKTFAKPFWFVRITKLSFCNDSKTVLEIKEMSQDKNQCQTDQAKLIKQYFNKNRILYNTVNPLPSAKRDIEGIKLSDLGSNDSLARKPSKDPSAYTSRQGSISSMNSNTEVQDSTQSNIAYIEIQDSIQSNNINAILNFPCTPIETKVTYPGISSSVVPSVSKVLQETMPPERIVILQRWEKKMIRQLGEEGFKEYKKETFRKGHTLHKAIELLYSGIPIADINVDPANCGHWQSLQPVISTISDVKVLEGSVTHPHLHYKGIFDCLAIYKDCLCLIDWKTSQKPKPTIKNTYDNPIQIAAYVGAVNYDSAYSFKVNTGCIVVAYEDGSPANVHHMDAVLCNRYWYMWTKRLHQFWLTEH